MILEARTEFARVLKRAGPHHNREQGARANAQAVVDATLSFIGRTPGPEFLVPFVPPQGCGALGFADWRQSPDYRRST